MAEVIWNKQAENEWRKKIYRYFHLMGSLKLLYYYVESSDTIRIADVWNSRREPAKLQHRI